MINKKMKQEFVKVNLDKGKFYLDGKLIQAEIIKLISRTGGTDEISEKDKRIGKNNLENVILNEKPSQADAYYIGEKSWAYNIKNRGMYVKIYPVLYLKIKGEK